jgi:transcriptional regulator with XRE-family HTH domain
MFDTASRLDILVVYTSTSIQGKLGAVNMDVLDAIRQAIDRSGRTRYRIARDTGLDESNLSKLMRGEAGLSIESLTKLAEYLGLELVVRPKKGKGLRGKHR